MSQDFDEWQDNDGHRKDVRNAMLVQSQHKRFSLAISSLKKPECSRRVSHNSNASQRLPRTACSQAGVHQYHTPDYDVMRVA